MRLTHPGPSRCRPRTRSSVTASPVSTASRRSGPYAFAVDRTSAQCRVIPPSGCSGRSTMPCPWSSSITSTPGWRASSSRSSPARAPLTAAPVGFCAREVTTSARAPASRARSTASARGPSSSTATGSTRRPSADTRSSTLPQPGSSTATASPGRRWAASTRSIPSRAPEVTASGPAGDAVRVEVGSGQPRQLGRDRVLPVERRRLRVPPGRRRQRPVQRGEQRHVRIALREVPYAHAAPPSAGRPGVRSTDGAGPGCRAARRSR